MSKLHVRKGDTVQVITGKDRGLTGKVIEVYPESDRVIVEGVNRIKKHTRVGQSARGAKTGGIVTTEALRSRLERDGGGPGRRPPHPRRLPQGEGGEASPGRLHLRRRSAACGSPSAPGRTCDEHGNRYQGATEGAVPRGDRAGTAQASSVTSPTSCRFRRSPRSS